MNDSPESKNPQLNIRPNIELYGRLTVLAAVHRITPPEMARRILTDTVEQMFEEYPKLYELDAAIEEVRNTMQSGGE